MESQKPSLCSSLGLIIVPKFRYTRVALQILKKKKDNNHFAPCLNCMMNDLTARACTREWPLVQIWTCALSPIF